MQTSDEAAEAEQLRSQQTALPLARNAVTFELKFGSAQFRLLMFLVYNACRSSNESRTLPPLRTLAFNISRVLEIFVLR